MGRQVFLTDRNDRLFVNELDAFACVGAQLDRAMTDLEHTMNILFLLRYYGDAISIPLIWALRGRHVNCIIAKLKARNK